MVAVFTDCDNRLKSTKQTTSQHWFRLKAYHSFVALFDHHAVQRVRCRAVVLPAEQGEELFRCYDDAACPPPLPPNT